MLYRYDFNEKLDLSRFRKQAAFYIGKMRELAYDLYLPNYKMRVEIARIDDSSSHISTIYFYQLERDGDGELVNERIVIPLTDMRFKDLTIVKELFTTDNYKAHYQSSSVESTVDKICAILKIIHKINNLKAFY